MRRATQVVSLLALLFATSEAGRAQTAITTERYDNARTGANLSETSLNTSNVNVGQFGKLYSYTVDGFIQAQPLYVPNVAVAGKGAHNVLYVVTMNDVLYAFDADSSSVNGGVLWSVDFRNPSAGVTPIPITDIVGNNNLNIVGNVGIESTPVIDLSTNTMYLVARTKEVSGSNTNYIARLHALDITSGAEKLGGPVVITASDPVAFDSLHQNQRSSLALVNGMVLFSWASHEDKNVWYGWIMAYSAQTLAQLSAFCTTPGDAEGGVWMSGRAPVVDSGGNVYYASGNGGWDGVSNFGDSVLKFSTTNSSLSLKDYFTPDDYANLQSTDQDLGSSGPMLIPGTNLLVHGGKESIFYLLSLSSLGHEQAGNNQIVQSFSTTGSEIHGGPVFWNRTTGAGPTMYVWPDNISLQAYQFNGATFNPNPISQSTIAAPSGSSGGVLTLSANGSTAGTGIVWSSMPLTDDADHGVHQGVLRAFDANVLTTELWDSQMNSSRDNAGLWPKYSPPTVANGKVYMASFSNLLNVYGLLSQNPDFGIVATPSVQSVAPSGSTTYTVETTSQGGFNGTVVLTVSGLPSGTTASFSPASITPPATSILTVNTTSATPVGTYNLTISGASGSLSHSATVSINVAGAGQGSGVISIKFVGQGSAMASSETAGVISKGNWNNASGASSTSSLSLFDESGNATSAMVSWTSDNVWELPVTDQPGNVRMMRGYLDTGRQDASIVTVNGLPANPSGYNVFVYADGDNGSATRTATYEISGTGITTASSALTDAANTDFSGIFAQANNSNGNYVLFTNINATGFTVSAIPGTASDNIARAPLNAIQIVPLAQSTPDFTLSATPQVTSVAQGASANFSISATALNGFSGAVNLSATGLPSGASGSFSPASITSGTNATLTITTTASTPVGSSNLTITGTNGSLTHTVAVTLIVASASGSSGNVISIQFVGTGNAMAATEVAGVVPRANWNPATGLTPAVPLGLVDETGLSSGATVTWTADNLFNLSITDQPGNARMMRGYLDDKLGQPTSVTVAGLASNSSGYNVYVYADGNNGSATRAGNYQISGTGITTTSISLTDAANADFNGTFTQANNSNGNYVVFPISSTGFTLTVTPGAASDGTPRAPLNAIQIVPLGPPTPDFSFVVSPGTASVTQGSTTSYSISTSALNGFTGSISFTASGLPTGASASFSPASITAGGSATATMTTLSTTPVGSAALTITGASGALTHNFPVTLNVTAPPDFSLSATPPSSVVNPGGSTTYTVSAGALNGFTDSINLSASGLPAGAVASFNPTSIVPGVNSTLTITTTSGVAIGSSTITITGSAGSLAHTATVTLNVSASPDFSISASPASASVAQGVSATYTVNVAGVNGFAGSVSLSAGGLPAGATSSFSPASIGPAANSTLTVSTASNTPVGTFTITITGASGSLNHSATVSLTVTTGMGGGTRVISVQFVGQGSAMAASEVAGSVAKSNWNQASGASGSSTSLVDEFGNATGVSLSWNAQGIWQLPVTDQPGNVRMMKGYLDTSTSSTTTVTVGGLPQNSNGYNIYVYCDGDNGGATRSATYQISGSGITTTTVGLTDAANTNFSGTFLQASNSNGNYVVFPINATSFTLSATPGTASDGTQRAPVNGIQIVPAGPPTPDFTLSALPATASVPQGVNSATFTVGTTSLNGFSGSISLSASGLPTGATASFSPSTITAGSSSTLTITTSAGTPVGNSTLTISGTASSLLHSTTVIFTVSPTGASANAIGIKFFGTGSAMGSSEIAGVVPASNWNSVGWFNGTSTRLLNGAGNSTTATVTWQADGQFALSIADQPGNFRMMRGYLDNAHRNATTIAVSGLPANPNGYTVYVYADGSNGSATRSGTYQVSGSGITTTSISLTDAANKDFSGTFIPANNSSGNYVVFTISATGFTLTATPGTASDGTKRAPVNAIQIVPR